MESICPHLGLIDDSETTATFPTWDHACNLTSPPTLIALDYQRSCCLDSSHINCPGFKSSWEDGFPKDICGHAPKRLRNFPKRLVIILSISIITIIILIVTLSEFSNNIFHPIATIGEVPPTHTATQPSVPSTTPTFLPTVTSTTEPSPTIIPTQTLGPGIQTPFGSSDFTFVVHEVLPGETFSSIALTYNTNSEVIESINQLFPPERTVLWVGDILVVCLECQETNEIPELQAVFINSRESVADLAETYNTEIEDLIRWNGLGEGDYIDSPRWIIVRAYW